MKKVLIMLLLGSASIMFVSMAITFKITDKDKEYILNSQTTYNVTHYKMNVNIQQEVKEANSIEAKYDKINANKASDYVKQNTTTVNDVPNVVSVDKSTGAMTFNTGNAKIDAVLHEATSHLGSPYQSGATGPTVFDCSGLTQYCYSKAAGIDITRTTYTQILQGKVVKQSELKPGDLVFPHTGHVCIYLGNNKMIHAPQTGDVVKISNVYAFYAGRRIIDW